MATNHILLLGAHGNIGKMMIPKFLKESWAVTALIRTENQRDEMLKLKSENEDDAVKQSKASLDILVHSLYDIKTSKDANEVIKKASEKQPVNWIVWTAGAGGKSAPTKPERAINTNAIDRDAAIAFAYAATHNSQIEKYLTISAINARRNAPSWWGESRQEILEQGLTDTPEGGMKTYTLAKLAADECLTTWGKERKDKDTKFNFVVLRPGLLDGETKVKPGKIQLGRTEMEHATQVRREDVAKTAVALLKEGVSGWFDLLEGDKDIKTAVEEVVKAGEKGQSIAEEDPQKMTETAKDFENRV